MLSPTDANKIDPQLVSDWSWSESEFFLMSLWLLVMKKSLDMLLCHSVLFAFTHIFSNIVIACK